MPTAQMRRQIAGILAQTTDTPYKVLDTSQLMGNGGIDYVCADNDGRRVYVPRGGNTFVFDLDSHKYIGTVTNVGGHGVAIDTKHNELTLRDTLNSVPSDCPSPVLLIRNTGGVWFAAGLAKLGDD